jgi:hypothetical protein
LRRKQRASWSFAGFYSTYPPRLYYVMYVNMTVNLGPTYSSTSPSPTRTTQGRRGQVNILLHFWEHISVTARSEKHMFLVRLRICVFTSLCKQLQHIAASIVQKYNAVGSTERQFSKIKLKLNIQYLGNRVVNFMTIYRQLQQTATTRYCIIQTYVKL